MQMGVARSRYADYNAVLEVADEPYLRETWNVSGAVANRASQEIDLELTNSQFADADPEQLIRWAHESFGDGLAMTSSFGAQAAVMLHLVTRIVPDIPIIALDTGYLFPETYKFAQELTDRLKLNVKWYQPRMTAAQMEAVHGQLWKSEDEENYRLYHEITKGEPMQRALKELNVTAWLAGLRSQQTNHRASLRPVEKQDGIVKVHPILRWSTKDVHEYLKTHDLPYHPLYEQGYMSIGDSHSSAPITADDDERAGRFQGLRQECGLHLPSSTEESQSRDSSGL